MYIQHTKQSIYGVVKRKRTTHENQSPANNKIVKKSIEIFIIIYGIKVELIKI